MKFTNLTLHCVRVVLVSVSLSVSNIALSQKDTLQTDSLETTHFVSGRVLVTTNGIAPAPAFTIDNPAVQLHFSFGRKRLTLDPSVRYSLDGKPWFVFVSSHYKAILRDRYTMDFGVHPFLTFGGVTATMNGVEQEVIQSYRNFSLDHTQSWKLNKHFGVGTYYFWSHCFDTGPRNIHFYMLTTSITNINLFKGLQFHLFPRLYYMTNDNRDGWYFTGSCALTKKDFPLSLEAIINKKINSIIEGKDLIWNVSLVYSFNKEMVEMKPGI